MLAGFYGAQQELKPTNASRVKVNLLESKQVYKSIVNPNGRVKNLHLFQYQDPIIQGPEEEPIEYEVEYIVHDVLEYDSLEGLSLQYGVSKTAIKSTNNITSDDIFYYKQLKIPQKQLKKSKSNIQTAQSEQNSPDHIYPHSLSPLTLSNRHHSDIVEFHEDTGLMSEVLMSEKDLKTKPLHSAIQDQNNSTMRKFDSAPYQSRPLN
jgi:LysM repeat protein